MHIARTGLDAQDMRMRVISNNLANVSTTGHKRDRAAFETLAYQVVTAPGAQSTAETRYAVGLNLGTGVRLRYISCPFAPFLDTGQVFNSFKNVSFKDYRITPGVGFRGIIRPNVVGRIDYGFSKEGGVIFAGLDFPY